MPFVIDDDEAWWSAASQEMKTPWDFYRSAVDHKPPGVVWFYWLVDHLSPVASDPRVVRVVYTGMTIVAALVLGKIASKFQEKKGQEASSVGWITAILFLIVTAIPSPKLLAGTADGLIVNLTIFGYGLALLAEFPGVSLLGGMILGLALLIKQTAVFFCFPILLSAWPRKWSWKELSLFALGSLMVVVPSIFSVGVEDFLYWTWTYPKEVLTTVRDQLFHSNLEMFESLALFCVATFPLLFLMLKRAFKMRTLEWGQGLRDFRFLWLLSGMAAALLGKGLFLHYLLLFAPQFALLAAEALCTEAVWPKRTLSWIGAQYVFGVLILTLPFSGIFWGTDLIYFGGLGRVMKASLRPGERVLVWGGSALPLNYSGASHVTRFVLPRFAVAPYATVKTREIFHRELEDDVPDLVLDLHERGDNQFNNPIESEPFVANLISSRGYRVYVSPSVPWAKFYFRNPPLEAGGLVEVKGPEQIRFSYSSFPEEQKSWMRLVDLGRQDGISRLLEANWELRAGVSLELLERQGTSERMRIQAKALGGELRMLMNSSGVTSALTNRIEKLVSDEEKSAGIRPIPLLSSAWWPSLALVELQPKAFR